MGSEEKKGRREKLGDKLQQARSFFSVSGRRNHVVPGSESGTSSEDSTIAELRPSNSGTVQPLTLLFLYSRNDNAEGLAELLRDKPTLANAKDYDQRSALHIAATNGCVQAATVLLDNNADVNALDRWQNSPLADASCGHHEKTIQLLQARGGKLLGCHGQDLGPSIVPPVQHKSDWEIDPKEINLEQSTKIGKGSFGEIRKCSWRGTPVAVKTILPALVDDKLVVQDFRHEVDLLVRVRHPNIVQFLGAVTRRSPLMLITEFLSGGDLHAVIKESKGQLAASTIVSFALDMARGMTYLHSGPNVIIHRDLKPRNVLVGEHNQLKIADFGLSKLIKTKSMHDIYKMTGETGSYRYMAPEVFAHQQYDKSVDVFSFAIILFELFEGAAPFSNLDAYEAARVMAKEYRRPEFRAKHYPEGMTRLIHECWNPNPSSRPEFFDVIKKLEAMGGSVTTSPTRDHHIWPFKHSRRLSRDSFNL